MHRYGLKEIEAEVWLIAWEPLHLLELDIEVGLLMGRKSF